MTVSRCANRFPLLLVASLAITCSHVKAPPTHTRAKPHVRPHRQASPPTDPAWRKIYDLIEGENYEDALAQLATIRQKASKGENDSAAGAALIWTADLKTQLDSPTEAADYLRNEPWPKAVFPRTMVLLYYARMLGEHQLGSGSYDEDVSPSEGLPKSLADFSYRQMRFEQSRAWAEVWRLREALGAIPVHTPLGLFEGYLVTNDYPAHIRGTMRDTVSYLAGDAFARHGNEGNKTPSLSALLAPSTPMVAFDVATRQPVETCNAIYLDLMAWHTAHDRKEAALEAEVVRLQRLRDVFDEPGQHAAIRKHLQARLSGYRSLPWWSIGMAKLAEWTRNDGDPNSAHALASTCIAAYPDSPGGIRCKQLATKMEQPNYAVSAMKIDGARRRSIVVTHSNLRAMYFRAYKTDVVAHLQTMNEGKDYRHRDSDSTYDADEVKRIITNEKPAASWTSQLAFLPGADYDSHTTFVTPPLDRPGHYVIVASAKNDFGMERNKVVWTTLLRSDLVILSKVDGPDGMLVRVVSGKTGSPIQGAEVSLHFSDSIATLRSDKHGEVRFTEANHGYTLFLVAKLGDDISLATDTDIGNAPLKSEKSALVFTDRPIYRPGQTLRFRVAAFQGVFDTGTYRVLPRQQLTVRLTDSRRRPVATKTLNTNEFGSASGSFVLPSSSMLGRWTLRVEPGDGLGHEVRVEAYKRPAFEVSLQGVSAPARLEHPVKVTGRAAYYLGLPVASGHVTWRVHRDKIYPWWWPWDTHRAQGWHADSGEERDSEDGGNNNEGVHLDDDYEAESEDDDAHNRPHDDGERDEMAVASGTTSIGPDGTFHIEFKPSTERGLHKDFSYRYSIEADVTDPGGETRSLRHRIFVGSASVKATIAKPTDLYRDDAAGSIAVDRTDLAGTPRSGKGKYRIVALVSPSAPVLPAELPIALRSSVAKVVAAQVEKSAPKTEGDNLRPRWKQGPKIQTIVASWNEGKQVRSGELEHGPNGKAEITLQGLPAGAYRIHYETNDDFGERVQAWQEIFIMSGSGAWRPALPLFLSAERLTVRSGEKARIFAATGLADQPIFFEIFKHGKRAAQKVLMPGTSPWIELPVGEEDRGGFSVSLTAVRDHQPLIQHLTIYVPWENKKLSLSFSAFRDKLLPGTKETWQVQVNDVSGRHVAARFAEVLAYMYDRSLELFSKRKEPDVAALYPIADSAPQTRSFFGENYQNELWDHGLDTFIDIKSPFFRDRMNLRHLHVMRSSTGRHGRRVPGIPAGEQVASRNADDDDPSAEEKIYGYGSLGVNGSGRATAADKENAQNPDTTGTTALIASPDRPQTNRLRRKFSETAFFFPHLVTDRRGRVTFTFEVPDAVTSWRASAHAITKDLAGGSVSRTAETIGNLMVRPYAPRFLRDGDEAEIAVMVTNAATSTAAGEVTLDVVDVVTRKSLLGQFVAGTKEKALTLPFSVAAGQGARLAFRLKAPARVGSYGLLVTAKKAGANAIADGELRPFMVLPAGRHTVESRFAVLGDNQSSAKLTLPGLAASAKESTSADLLVASVDAQLFYVLVKALPYLIEYPYECAEQTLNRFVSTGIMASLFQGRQRGTEKKSNKIVSDDESASKDAGATLLVEESPWAYLANGPGTGHRMDLFDHSQVVAARDRAIARLATMQTRAGGFSWFPGGSPSPYMTLYILSGFAKAAEFGVEPPSKMLDKGWQFLANHVNKTCKDPGNLASALSDCDTRFFTFLNYVASSYGEPSWANTAFPRSERQRLLALTFADWRSFSSQLKGMLALTLLRMSRSADAKLVFGSVMASAQTSPIQGTHFQHSTRGWQRDSDEIENHAFSLRTLLELDSSSDKLEGLVVWLLLNRKLDQWKSTRATSEVLYALAKYLTHKKPIARREEATVTMGVGHAAKATRFVFSPTTYTGRAEARLTGAEITADHANITIEKKTKGMMFASATWHHFSKELPKKSTSGGLEVTRTYFLRRQENKESPLTESDVLKVGDVVEVKLAVQASETTEYVHLRDPRPAGLEPEAAASGYRWHGGADFYEETRDSSANFFFERLPAGQYTFTHRLRVNMAGTFRVGSAVIQSMYAPELAGTSAGNVIAVKN